MVTQYPAKIDTSITLPKVIDLVTPVQGKVYNDLRDAIIAIEEELGVKPSSVYGTVRARLDFLEQNIGGGGGSQNLSQVLALGNQTGGNGIVFSDGDTISSESGTVTVNSALSINGDTTANGNAIVNGNTTINGDAIVTGKLTVSGLIDPTGLVLDSQDSVPGGVPASSHGTIWINDADQHIIFTDDGGTDHDLLAGGGGSQTLSQTLALGNTTDGTSIVISNGDSIRSKDATSGNDPGFDLNLISGSGSGTGAGGNIILTASSGSSAGGNINLIAGSGATEGTIFMTGGATLVSQGSAQQQAGAGVLWTLNSSPVTLFFTDDTGASVQLGLKELAPGTYVNETLGWDGTSSWVGSPTIAVNTINDSTGTSGLALSTAGDVVVTSGGLISLTSATNIAISCATAYTIQTDTYNLQPTSGAIIQGDSFVVQDSGASKVLETGSGQSFGAFGTSPTTQPTVTGAKLESDDALASLLAALVSLGWIVDATT